MSLFACVASACSSAKDGANPAPAQAAAMPKAAPGAAHDAPAAAPTPRAPEVAPPTPAPNPHANLGLPSAPPSGGPQNIQFDGQLRTEKLPDLSWKIPQQWPTQPTSSTMRVAQYVVPGPGGDAEIVVFRFPGGAGTVEANVARWKGQFQPPEDKTIDEVTQTTTMEVGKLQVTLVELSGRYKTTMPATGQPIDEADMRMQAAVVQGQGDPYFIRLLGPSKTVELWAKAYEDALKSLAP